MKDYQILIGAMFIAAAILLSVVLISSSIQEAGSDIGGTTGSLIGTSISNMGAQLETAISNPAE